MSSIEEQLARITGLHPDEVRKRIGQSKLPEREAEDFPIGEKLIILSNALKKATTVPRDQTVAPPKKPDAITGPMNPFNQAASIKNTAAGQDKMRFDIPAQANANAILLGGSPAYYVNSSDGPIGPPADPKWKKPPAEDANGPLGTESKTENTNGVVANANAGEDRTAIMGDSRVVRRNGVDVVVPADDSAGVPPGFKTVNGKVVPDPEYVAPGRKKPDVAEPKVAVAPATNTNVDQATLDWYAMRAVPATPTRVTTQFLPQGTPAPLPKTEPVPGGGFRVLPNDTKPAGGPPFRQGPFSTDPDDYTLSNFANLAGNGIKGAANSITDFISGLLNRNKLAPGTKTSKSFFPSTTKKSFFFMNSLEK